MKILGKIQDWILNISGSGAEPILDFLTDELGNNLSDESGNILTL